MISGSGDDYEAVVGEVVHFKVGEKFKTHTITINDDIICENSTNESFFSKIALSAGTQLVSLVDSVTTVTIDDSNQAECCKLLPFDPCFYRHSLHN